MALESDRNNTRALVAAATMLSAGLEGLSAFTSAAEWQLDRVSELRGAVREKSEAWGWRRANLAVPVGMVGYAAIIGLLCHGLGHGGDFRPDLYVTPFYASYLLYAATLGAILELRRRTGRLNRRLLLFFSATWTPADLVGRMISALPFLLAFPIFMSSFTAAKNLLDDCLPFTWDQDLASIGPTLLFGRHAWEWLDIKSPAITHALEFAYVFWGVLLVAVPFAVCLRRADCRLRARFLVSYVLILVILGNVVAGLFMSAGPFWFHFTGGHDPEFGGLFSYLAQTDPDSTLSALAFQTYLWKAHVQGITYLGTGISAFPSIHVAISTLYALFAWRFGRVARIASIAYLAAIIMGSIHLGWHYSADVLAGGFGAAAIYGIVGWVQNLRLGTTPRLYRPAIS